MRVGPLLPAGSPLRRLVLLTVVLGLAVPATAHGQAPATVTFDDAPSGVTSATSEQFSFSSSAEGVASYACSVDTAPFADCTSPVTVDDLTQGPHSFAVQGLDAAGSVMAEGQVDWVVDLTKPTATILSGPSGPTPVGTTSVTFASADADLAFFQCKLDGEPYVQCKTPLEVEVGPGSHTLLVRAVDAAGNEGEPGSLSWTGQAAAPPAPALDGTSGVVKTSNATFTFSATGAEGFECSVDGGAYSACASPKTVTVTGDGTHTFAVRGVAAGGVAGPSSSASWTVDTTAPTVTIAPAPGRPADVTSEREATFVFSSSDATATLECSLDGGAYKPCASGETFPVDPGTHTFTVRATDPVGNAATATDSWTVDAEAPDVLVVAAPSPVTRSRTAEFVLRSEDGSTLSCRLLRPGVDTPFTPCGESQRYAGLVAGDYIFEVQAVDAAGNPKTVRYAWRVDEEEAPTVAPPTTPVTPFDTGTAVPAPGAPPPTAGPGPEKLTLLKPFPTVRIAGTAVGGQIRLRIFAVRAPGSTTVDVRCRGRGCPFALDRHRVKGKTRTVRIRRLEGRALRAGMVLEIRVHAIGRIGKYTRLFMRAGAAPKRTDACVSGTRLLKVACPA
jgi:hypothetical protein